jgi:hypothetical protein
MLLYYVMLCYVRCSNIEKKHSLLERTLENFSSRITKELGRENKEPAIGMVEVTVANIITSDIADAISHAIYAAGRHAQRLTRKRHHQ